MLHRQTMTIPAPSPPHSISIHSLEPRNSVLYCTSQNMPVVWKTRGERWSVIENKISFWGLFFQSFLKNLIVFPESQCFLLTQSMWRFEVFLLQIIIHSSKITLIAVLFPEAQTKDIISSIPTGVP